MQNMKRQIIRECRNCKEDIVRDLKDGVYYHNDILGSVPCYGTPYTAAPVADPKYGDWDWLPISRTRHASILRLMDGMSVIEYGVRCVPCNWPDAGRGKYIPFSTLELAQAKVLEHDNTHLTSVAACCMFATGAVCKCGNELV